LSAVDRAFLNKVWREHPTYTVRCRAHAILLSARGFTVTQLQSILSISRRTALAWLDRWKDRGRDGLEDAPRSGGPPKLNEQEQEVFREELRRHPRQPKRVIEAVEQRTGKRISRTTLRRMARKCRFRWKRMRRSLRKRRDERLFRAAQKEIEEFRASSNLEVAFFDEAAFSLSGGVPYGWQPIGERQEVSVGARGVVQVLGIMEEHGETLGYLHRGSVKGTTVAEVLDDYSRRIIQPTVLILDNAMVHTCNLIFDSMPVWNARGLYFYFLPTYSPELNDIERLWDKIKHQTLPLTAWQSLKNLLGELKDTFSNLGEAILMPSLAT
jgi:transposase